jgi:tetratricopeptide (TPR) repeat protein
MDFLVRENIHGRVYNSFNIGDYFIWRANPKELVFIDSRLEVYGQKHFQEYEIPLYRPDQWESFANKWDITYVLLMHMGPMEGGLISRLFSPAKGGTGWALVYYDLNSCVFLRRIPQYSPVIKRNEKLGLYSGDISTPPGDPSSYRPQKAVFKGKLGKIFHKAPETFDPIGLANFFMIIGQFGRAELSLERALKIDKEMPEIQLILGQLRLEAGDPARAREWFRNTLELEPESAAALEGFGLASLALGDKITAEIALRKALKIDPALKRSQWGLNQALYGKK